MGYEFFNRYIHISSQRPGHISNVVRNIRPRQVESPRRQIGRIRFDENPFQRKDRHGIAQGSGSPFIANPAGNTNIKAQIEHFGQRLLVASITMDDGLRTNSFMPFKTSQEIVSCIPFVQEQRLVQFFGHSNEGLEKMELILFLRIHAIVIEPCFTDGDDFRIRHDDAPDFF